MSELLFADRMREAVVVMPEEEMAICRAAVSDIATRHGSGSTLLDFVRLAFGRDIDPAAYEKCADEFRLRGVALPRCAHQLVATLAGLALIERFGRDVGRKGVRRLIPDSAAALAIRVLVDQGVAAVHPDLESYATRWLMSVTRRLRDHPGAAPRLPALPGWLSFDDDGGASGERRQDPAVHGAPGETPSSGLPTSLRELHAYAEKLQTWLDDVGGSRRVGAIEEELGLLWWLQSRRPRETPVAAVVAACDELDALCRFVPGPPAAEELLARRLGEHADVMIRVADLVGVSSRPVPCAVEDLCPLSRGMCPDDAVLITARTGAEWLYHEVQLARLVGGGNDR